MVAGRRRLSNTPSLSCSKSTGGFNAGTDLSAANGNHFALRPGLLRVIRQRNVCDQGARQHAREAPQAKLLTILLCRQGRHLLFALIPIAKQATR